jgi:cytochrome b6-f complex iron-sulfur subunit
VAGGFVFLTKTIDIIIAHTINDEYVAVSARCTHQGSLVAYYPSDIFFCSKHGATFDTKGVVKQGPAVNALQLFKTRLSGTNLRVYS